MTHIQIIPGEFQITDPAWPRLNLWAPSNIFTSDDFSGPAGDPVGRNTNAVLGGQPVPWVGNPGSWSIGQGVLSSPAATGTLVVEAPANSYELAATIKKLPVASHVILTTRRTALNFSSTLEQVYASIFANGTINVDQRVGGQINRIQTVEMAVKAGDRVALQVDGTTVTVTLNGTTIVEGTTAVEAPGHAGFSVGGTGIAAQLDDFTLTPL